MAGIGFELRKLYRKQGLVNSLQAYAYSTMTTIGPMILCLILVFVQQILMKQHGVTFLENELFIATLAYCFVFSIILTSGITLLITRYIADCIYEKNYTYILNAYYGSLFFVLPVAAIIAGIFLFSLDESFFYKAVAYLFFVELVVIWTQNVFMSALKDYKRIFRSFAFAVLLSIIVSFLLFKLTTLSPVIIALLGMDVGFASIIIFSAFHFEHVFPSSQNNRYFAYFSIAKRYPSIFISGVLLYSGVYIHNLVYWFLSDSPTIVAGQYYLMPFYDVPVFYAYLSVLPSLIFFVVIIETDFYERFLSYYKNITEGGTYESVQTAKKKMQRVLIKRMGFLAEVQLLFTALAIAVGILYLSKIGFTMEQLDVFITLCLAYFFFILMFVAFHLLMYFDDRKGILILSGVFVLLCATCTYFSMQLALHGMGLFIAAFISLCAVLLRLSYITKNIDYFTYCPQPVQTLSPPKKFKALSPKSLRFFSLIALIFIVGCSDAKSDELANANLNTPPISENQIVNNFITIDDKRIYERDHDATIKTLYMTVLPDSKQPTLDWYGLNRIIERFSEDNLKIILQEGLPNGGGIQSGMFGFDTTEANAKISLRGNTARNQPQKSYKINLLDSAGTWNDQTTINLNKHFKDMTKVRNKLSFDLMESIPNVSSLRTQFIHLYVKDTTVGSTVYEDYGLYTHVEQPNKKFLRNHLFDPNGYLYKVTFFEFGRYPEQIKSETDPLYDKNEFESILEIKGREEHDKLIQMLNDVNNYEIPINDVIAHHFDEENLLTWLAVNILMDNMDTDANNFYIYSPLNIHKWLILPWDYDDGWNLGRKTENIRPYQAGISNYWGNILLNRYFRDQVNVDKFTAKLEEVYADYINEEIVENQLAKYEESYRYIEKMPDVQFLSGKVENLQQELDEIIATPKLALLRYYEDLDKPKPFYMHAEVLLENNHHIFSWQPSFNLQGDIVYYSAVVARDPALTDIVADAHDLRETEMKVPELQPGTYYLSVTVKDEQGHTNAAFDLYLDDDGVNHFQTIQVEVP
ncbi:exopolysaccharide Pel transporter PelG [Solibacillus sp. FSL H8-0523]|uniref:exopolysaccharide Pel transporter PelG n=1 Tax=Solibacillus sp. FSL H8-0523 TaxID=2954511 RepID=UPI00310199D3